MSLFSNFRGSIRQMIAGLLLLGHCFVSLPAQAEFDLECYIKNNCPKRWGRSTSNPSTGSQVRINPSAVPTEKGFGIEGIYFSQEVDLALARGLGRAGAAISPSNSEETFFGPPGIEYEYDYFARHLEPTKFPSQKYTLAAAVKLIDKLGSGLTRLNLSLGLMGKYNKYTGSIKPGVGVSGTLGFISFGGSFYQDETQLDGDLPKEQRPEAIRYEVQTYNVGVFLNSLALDYSHMLLNNENGKAKVSLYTASLTVKKYIFTIAQREEESDRAVYNYITNQLDYIEKKQDYFGGVQYSLSRNLTLGVLYNYYLLHEGSVSATVFF